jgi:uncharacterized protein YjbI with pentapeptide repeats
VRDDGGTANGGIDTSAARTATLDVSVVGGAPVVATGALDARDAFDGDTTVEAGAKSVPLANVPASAFFPSLTSTSSTPLSNTPLSNTPLSNTPLSNTPLSNTPLSNTGLLDDSPAVVNALGTIQLSSLPLLRPGGWSTLLGGIFTDPATGLDAPIQTLTLKDVVTNPTAAQKLADLQVDEIDWSLSPLGSLTWTDLALGLARLSTIDISRGSSTALEAWCAALAGPPISCTTPSSLADATVLSTAIQGAPLANTPLANTPLSNTPLSTPLANTDLAGTPLANTPLVNTPLANTRIGQLPLANTPLANTAFTSTPLSNTPLSNTPLSDTPLSNTPLSNTQLSNTSLGQTGATTTPLSNTPLANTPLSNTPLKTPLANTPLANTQLVDMNLTTSPLANTPVSDVSNPQLLFSCPASVCPTQGSIAANRLTALPGTTLADLIRSTQSLQSLTVDQLLLSLGPDALEATTLGQVLSLFSERERSGVQVWMLFAGLPELTLADVFASIPPAVLALRIDDLLAFLRDLYRADPSRNPLTLADVIALLMGPQATGWESLDLPQARPQSIPGAEGGTVAYDAAVSVAAKTTAPAGYVPDVKVSVSIPDDFAYLPGSARLDDVAIADPKVKPGVALTWTVPLELGKTYHLTFRAMAGITLGSRGATLDVVPVPANSVPAPRASSQTTVVGDTFEDNSAYSGAVPAPGARLGSDRFYLSYVKQPGDVDYFTFDVPSGMLEGTRVTFRLSHLPQDYDLVVYGPVTQLHDPVAGTEGLDAQALAAETPALTHTNDVLPAPTLDDVIIADPLPAGVEIVGVSTQRGTENDAVTVVSQGRRERYVVQVSGFNGASSSDPYMLRVSAQPPTPLVCSKWSPPDVSVAVPAVQPSAPSASVNTVFVVNATQFVRAYGTSAGLATLNDLSSALPQRRRRRDGQRSGSRRVRRLERLPGERCPRQRRRGGDQRRR